MSQEYFSIGEVVKRLQLNYPDLSVSKIRYLEEEGLISPRRSASGYRKFSPGDIERLEKILYLQKSYFYPLSVIKEELLREQDANRAKTQVREAKVPLPMGAEDKLHPIDHIPDLIGVDISFVRQLAEFSLIELTLSPKGLNLVDGRDLALIKAAFELKRYGVQPRHLKSYVIGVHRESPIFEAVLSNLVGKQNQELTEEMRQRFEETLESMESLTQAVHSSLLKKEVRKKFTHLDL